MKDAYRTAKQMLIFQLSKIHFCWNDGIIDMVELRSSVKARVTIVLSRRIYDYYTTTSDNSTLP